MSKPSSTDRYVTSSENGITLTDDQKREMEQYRLELLQLKNDLRSSQTSSPNSSNRTSESIQQFIDWAKKRGISNEYVTVGPSQYGGLGLFAQKSCKENDLLLEVPCSVMLTATDALNNRRLDDFYADPFIKSSPTLILVFYLLYQDNNPKSEWKPFLDILPREYSSILSLPDEEMKLFEGSEIFTEIHNVQQILLVQYRYFKKRLDADAYGANSKTLFGEFTLKRFLWAYEAVWTRQNYIPKIDKKSSGNDNPPQVGALIPFWDMANHRQGKPVSDFSVEAKSLLFYSMADSEKGQEVFNFYGDRSNVQLYTTNGFVDLETPFLGPIKFTIKIREEDPNSGLQKQLCEKLQIKSSQCFWLPLKTDVMPESSTLYAMRRIVLMNKTTLEQYLQGDASTLLEYNPSTSALTELDNEADRWLKVRCAVLLRKYPKIDKIENPHIERLLRDEKLVLRSYAMEMAPKEA